MVVGGSDIGNNDNDENIPGLVKNHQGEGGRVRIGKEANVEDIDVKGDGDGLTLLSSSPVDEYIDGESDGFCDENYGRGGCDRPCTSSIF